MRYKVIWTSDLHEKFLEAVHKLGVDNAVPKKIVELMKVKGLTRDHVASHLQKYRILSKKISAAYYQAHTSSNSSLINHEQKNWPSYNGMHMMNPLVLDTSSSYLPVLESSNFNTTVSSELAHSGSLPNEGYYVPVMTNNLDEQGKLYDDANNTGVVISENSSTSRFMQNLDGFIYDYGCCSTDVQPYNNNERGSSSGIHLNKELTMTGNHEKPISIGNSSNSFFVENSIGFESNYFGQNEFVEMGSSSGVHLNKELTMNRSYGKLISNENSSNSSFVECSIGFESNYIGQNEFVEMGSPSGVHLNKELTMNTSYEKPISNGNSSNSLFVECSIGFESNYIGQNEFIEMGSSSGMHLNKELTMNTSYEKLISNGNSNNSSFVEPSIGFESNYIGQNEFVEMGSSSGVHLNKELMMNPSYEKLINNGNSNHSSFVEHSIGIESNYIGQNEFVEMGSSSGVHLNKELTMNRSCEKLISNGNSSNSSFVECSNGFESNYIGQNEFVEMGSFYGSNSNNNLEKGIEEDDLMLNEDAMAFLLSYADSHGDQHGSTSNKLTFTLQPPNQDVNGQNFSDIVSFGSNMFNEQHSNEQTITDGNQQTLHGYIPAFDPTFNMHMWSPEPLGDHMIHEDLFLDPFIKD